MSSFPGEASLAEIAAVIGDPGRARMLVALMGGEALPAGELAWQAGVRSSTASGHLAQLVRVGLLLVLRQGRHRYYRLATPDVARLLETMLAVAATQAAPRHRPESARDTALRRARTCYDHLAGRLGVAIADGLVAAGHLALGDGAAVLQPSGRRLLDDLGVDLGRSAACRACLDWSERRHHLGGVVGTAMTRRFFALRWVERLPESRAVRLTPAGGEGLSRSFGVDPAPFLVAPVPPCVGQSAAATTSSSSRTS